MELALICAGAFLAYWYFRTAGKKEYEPLRFQLASMMEQVAELRKAKGVSDDSYGLRAAAIRNAELMVRTAQVVDRDTMMKTRMWLLRSTEDEVMTVCGIASQQQWIKYKSALWELVEKLDKKALSKI